jgi:hypothetical protein
MGTDLVPETSENLYMATELVSETLENLRNLTWLSARDFIEFICRESCNTYITNGPLSHTKATPIRDLDHR